MRFRVVVQLYFVNNSMSQPIALDQTIYAADREALEKLITPDWIMENVSDDWGPPIRSVSIVSAEAVSVG